MGISARIVFFPKKKTIALNLKSQIGRGVENNAWKFGANLLRQIQMALKKAENIKRGPLCWRAPYYYCLGHSNEISCFQSPNRDRPKLSRSSSSFGFSHIKFQARGLQCANFEDAWILILRPTATAHGLWIIQGEGSTACRMFAFYHKLTKLLLIQTRRQSLDLRE